MTDLVPAASLIPDAAGFLFQGLSASLLIRCITVFALATEGTVTQFHMEVVAVCRIVVRAQDCAEPFASAVLHCLEETPLFLLTTGPAGCDADALTIAQHKAADVDGLRARMG